MTNGSNEELRQSEAGCERKGDAGVIPAALLPCPWGHAGEAVINTKRDEHKIAAWVECDLCGCRGVWAGWYKDESEAKKWAAIYWNQRAKASEAYSYSDWMHLNIRGEPVVARFQYKSIAEASASTDESTKPKVV